MNLRPEEPGDRAGIHAVHAACFPTPGEADLVDALRSSGRLAISLVAEVEGELVAHVAFSPVTLHEGVEPTGGIGLAPVGTLEAFRKRGIADALVRRGLELARDAGFRYAVVLGDPDYYGRFGFLRARDLGLEDEYGAAQHFQAQELVPGGIPDGGGLVQYAPEFAELG